MPGKISRSFLLTILISFLFSIGLWGRSLRIRCMWRNDPATSMVIGWDQVSGADPVLYYDQADFGVTASAYRYFSEPNHIVFSKGMNNHFVRLTELTPNTVYYFLIKDSEGVSQRFSFRTAPDSPDERLSIIAGGDSRNNQGARLSANRLVSKLRPHCVVFAGDMTDGDNDLEWQEWFDDWQETIGSDGRVFPIIPARGNHEKDNNGIADLFDTPNRNIYYSLTLGGSLLRIITLNSSDPAGGEQRDWLERQLNSSEDVSWRFAQYHHSMRPHTARKEERNEQFINWSTLFYQYQVQAVLESDAHVVKCTYPIRPSNDLGNVEGFIRDDQHGTVYMGEGCWGSPLRVMDDSKSWTRQAGTFNQFKWIFVGQDKMEIRTIITDVSEQVAEVPHNNVFVQPLGLAVWRPNNEEVVVINNFRGSRKSRPLPLPVKPREEMKVIRMIAQKQMDGIAIRWTTEHETMQCQFELQRFQEDRGEYVMLSKARAKGQPANDYLFVDREPVRAGFQNVRYRLKCTHPDGTLFYKESQIEIKPRPAAGDWSQFPQLRFEPGNPDKVILDYQLNSPAIISAYVVNAKMEPVKEIPLGPQASGNLRQSLNLSSVPKGSYLLVLLAGRKPIGRYRLNKL